MRLADVERVLSQYREKPTAPDAVIRRAAVAVLLRERVPEQEPRDAPLEVLFIRRAEKWGDPWSGHMAFPGGHVDRSDASSLAAAVRETREEIGLDLTTFGRHLGALPVHQAMPRGRPIGMSIEPHVFAVTGDPLLRPNHEVAEVVWTPLDPLVSGETHTEEHRIVGGLPTAFSGYRVNGGHFVWGLTYRILHSLFELIDPRWEAPRQA